MWVECRSGASRASLSGRGGIGCVLKGFVGGDEGERGSMVLVEVSERGRKGGGGVTQARREVRSERMCAICIGDDVLRLSKIQGMVNVE